ncbi:MAG: acetate--CoA ligase [Nocardiaceae bacterium]|nr:acetate--CoA ligase [Nocardiaceae bacterium]
MDVITKDLHALSTIPNWVDYEGERERFNWTAVRAELGVTDDRCNIASVVEHRARGREAVALRFVGRPDDDGNFPAQDMTYADLIRQSSRFTNVLRSLGAGREDRMFVLMARQPELYVGILGALRNGTVVCPMFSSFGPEPIATRMQLGGATILLTTERFYRQKILPIRDRIPTLRHVLIVSDGAAAPVDTIDLHARMAEASDVAEPAVTTAEDPALLHFTSGTTGTPKGALHVHGAVITHFATGRYGLDLHPGDTFWCTADPGWVTGMSYGVITPLLHGVTSIIDSGEFDPELWYQILQQMSVSVWYTSPTAIRMLMKAGPELAQRYRYENLRFIASVGEPLNPEAVIWSRDVLGLPVHDNWWQTETGGIMIANTPAFRIKPGSMGRPLPGIDAFIVRRTGDQVSVLGPDTTGELALRAGWPGMFRGYLNNPERYAKCFVDGYYLTGDLARRDSDGYFWFVGRADDVIKSAGHLIGPFEIESAIMEHPAVAEAAVIGIPDPVSGQRVKAFVTLKAGQEPTDSLRRELFALTRRRLGSSLAPKEIEFASQLPHTRSGKVMRRVLKARELGLPTGDLSTLEAPL